MISPFLVINLGMLVCGNKSFLIEYRHNKDEGFGQCISEKRLDLVIFSILGVIFTLIISFIIIFFLRSSEFKD